MSQAVTQLPDDLVDMLLEVGNSRVLLLEGESDHGVFKIWYREYYELGELVFYVTNQKPFVLKYVQGGLAYNNAVFGVVDRDYINNENWQPNPEPNVFQLQYHELENYLMVPSAIREAIAIQNSPIEPPSIVMINEQIQEWATQMVVCVAGNWLIYEHNEQRGEAGIETFTESQQRPPRETIVNRISQATQGTKEDAENLLQNKEKQILEEIADLQKLHVWLDGKRLRHKLHQQYFSRITPDQLSNQLAGILKRQGIPPEIDNIVEKQVMGLSTPRAKSQNDKQKELRPYGLSKGVFKLDDSFFDPLPEDILDAFEGKG
jgi:Protein of unknown function (DUF4435)